MSPNDARRDYTLTPAVWAIVALTVFYVIAAAVGAVTTGNMEFVIYIAVMVVLIVVVGIVHVHFDLNVLTLAALSLWGLAHMAGGLVPLPASWPIEGHIRVLYSWWLIPGWLKYDHIVHAYGFGVTTWVCWQVIQHGMSRRYDIPRRQIPPTLSLMIICTTAATGFGALNEIVEFAATLVLAETNVGGYENTGWDLVSNLVGSTLAAVLIWGTTPRASTG
jgi:uncharacterized membrane protein